MRRKTEKAVDFPKAFPTAKVTDDPDDQIHEGN